jgi:hypothetical protein
MVVVLNAPFRMQPDWTATTYLDQPQQCFESSGVEGGAEAWARSMSPLTQVVYPLAILEAVDYTLWHELCACAADMARHLRPLHTNITWGGLGKLTG